MPKERAIDLQLIKPIETNGIAGKGKISIKRLLKEELSKLSVPYNDPCCNTNILTISSIIVDSYEEMLLQANGNSMKFIKVREDNENNSGDPSTYMYWPNFGIDLLATDSIIIF